jgi:hypothetical protein
MFGKKLTSVFSEGHLKLEKSEDEAAASNSKPRNLPPDGTTFSQISLGKRLEQTLPAYGYWNVQFYQVCTQLHIRTMFG